MLTFETWEQFDSWLAGNHDKATEVWLRIAKKNSGVVTLTAEDGGDVAIAYGWIDGLRRSHDDTYFLQRYSPRRPRTAWSKVNVERVERLTAAGRMRAPGLAEVEAAKADGRWEAAYESQRNATVPPDLAAALEASPGAKARFDAMSKTDRYAAILKLLKARTPASRANLLAKLVTSLEG